MNGYRKELKYIVGDDVLMDVCNRINGIMRPDEHQTGDHYDIRSIYFDSIDLRCFRENKAGVSPREKFRIRSYNCHDDLILAEIKVRQRDTISKLSTKIPREMFDAMILHDQSKAGELLISALHEYEDTYSGKDDGGDTEEHWGRTVLAGYLTKVMNERFVPAAIVCYERTAFVYDLCNVRITFDRNVFASNECERFFDTDLTGRPALEPGLHILEIKYDEFLPAEIRSVLGGLRLSRSSSSKYVGCMEVLYEL